MIDTKPLNPMEAEVIVIKLCATLRFQLEETCFSPGAARKGPLELLKVSV